MLLPSMQSLCGDAALGKDFCVCTGYFWVSNKTGTVMDKLSLFLFTLPFLTDSSSAFELLV